MKITKKKLAVVAMIVCVVTLVSTGSLAWFNDSKSISNKIMFTSTTDENPKVSFILGLHEYNTQNGAFSSTGLDYTKVLPGAVLDKKVQIRNEGYIDQYIRVNLTITGTNVWSEVFKPTDDIDLCDHFLNKTEYKDALIIPLNEKFIIDYDSVVVKDDALTVTLYYNGILKARKDQILFENVQIPTSLTKEQASQLAKVGDVDLGFKIDIVADAIQTDKILTAEDIAACEGKEWMKAKMSFAVLDGASEND